MNSVHSRNKIKYSGFTLVELSVVIAIIGILSVISIISFNLVRRTAVIDASRDEVFSALKMAKGYALQGKMPVGKTSICGYGFKFNSASQYSVFYYFDNTNLPTDPNYCKVPSNFVLTAVDMETLKNGAALISPTPSNSIIYFSIPWGLVVFSPSIQNYQVGYSGVTKNVTVDANGLIREP